MKKLSKFFAFGFSLSVAAVLLCSAASDSAQNAKIGIVNFKGCVECSKIGKQEQAAFEAMKKKIETTLEDKEKTLTEIANKFNDPDYLDSLSPEAEAELKHKFRTLNQELSNYQNQYYQILQQTNMTVLQKISEAVAKAAQTVAKNRNISVVLNEDALFFYSPDLDITKLVVEELDKTFEAAPKDAKPTL